MKLEDGEVGDLLLTKGLLKIFAKKGVNDIACLFRRRITHLGSVGDSSDAADPKILSLASAYSFSRCSRVLGWGFALFWEVEDSAGDDPGRLRIVTAGLGLWRILGRKSSPPFRIEKPFWLAVAISCSFLILSCFSCSNRCSSCHEKESPRDEN